jgi:EAL domain-containing protein (putative c-di-GMP-specific phosphodiesterase class I)
VSSRQCWGIRSGRPIADAEAAIAVLIRLKELGVGLSLDDFGTGYSSLSLLHRFPLDTLKIDRSFIQRIDDAGRNSEIVGTIGAMAKNLGMDVVAEGVETAAQRAVLHRLGCQYGQGYYFSRPIDGPATQALLRAHQPQYPPAHLPCGILHSPVRTPEPIALLPGPLT